MCVCWGPVAIVTRGILVDLLEKLTFQQSFEGNEGLDSTDVQGKSNPGGGILWQEQRPRGRFEKQQGAQCGQRGVSWGQRGKGNRLGMVLRPLGGHHGRKRRTGHLRRGNHHSLGDFVPGCAGRLCPRRVCSFL